MSGHDDFWQSLVDQAYTGSESLDFAGNYLTASEKEAAEYDQRVQNAVESRLSGKALNRGSFTSVRDLTSHEQGRYQIMLPVEAGAKVRFSSNTSDVLAYDDPPSPGEAGTVVSVKTGSGMATEHNGAVFVRWGDGKVRAIHAEHLRYASNVRSATAVGDSIRVASLGDLSDFLRVASDTLVHKATRDLWSLRKDGSDFVIERLFEEDGNPIKV
jgi:hypothetical protein